VFIAARYDASQSEGTSDGQGKIMEIWARVAQLATRLREFVVPTYRPERHYMRGPGPACARRGAPQ
jgi:hypothetical protein